jgi:putative ABC transport system permease protein
MRALRKKLRRDLWHNRGQVLSIAAVVATAIMTVLSMRGTYESLLHSRDAFYQESAFPHVWASLERAPESIKARIEGIDGVSAVDTRIRFMANLQLENRDVPVTALFSSVDPDVRSLGQLVLRSGRLPGVRERDRVVVNEKFAEANSLEEDDSFGAVINGQMRQLVIVGVAISPEYMYPLAPGSIFPDHETFGLVWMGREALAAESDMEGAFNEVALQMHTGFQEEGDVREEAVIDALDRILEPYGGLGGYGRSVQISHQFLEGELTQNRNTGTFIPSVFLAVVAFLLNIVLRRLVDTQRQEIAVLKAFGYTNWNVGWFYLRFALLAVLIGTAFGVVIGVWLGQVMVEMYKEFFVFPDLTYQFGLDLVGIAVFISVLSAAIGALGGVRSATSLPPAEAMRPKAPAHFRPGIFERMGFEQWLSSTARMVLRNIERQPFKSALSTLGVAFSVAILVLGMFMFDAIEYMMDLQFNQVQREDISVVFERPLPESVQLELEHHQSVTEAEVFRSVPVRFVNGHLNKEAGITGRRLDDDLQRIIDEDGREIRLPGEGIVLSRFLADQLGLEGAGTIRAEILEGGRPIRSVEVVDIVDDFLGASAYMELDALHRLAGGTRSVNGANLKLLPGTRDAVMSDMAELSSVSGVSSPRKMYEIFRQQMDEGFLLGVFFLVFFSSIIALAVIYNGARIALSERGRELASLRVLGFSKQEVAVLLFSEQGLITLVAIPMGWLLGYWMSWAMVNAFVTESYRIPFLVDSGTFLFSAAATVIAAVLSSLVVRRRLNRYDLISVLKTRD